MEKEKWKDDVLQSLTGLQTAEPGAFLFTRIEAQLQRATGLSRLQVRLAGVCVMILLTINLLVAINSNNTPSGNVNSLTTTYRY